MTDDDEDACGAGTACAVDDIILLAKLDDLFYTTTSNSVAADSFTFYVHDGTGFSTSTYTMAITVTPVNDAPTVSDATQALTAIDEDGTPSTSTTISSLYTASFADSADSDSLAGICITSYTEDTSEGQWKYSTNDGVSFTAIATLSLIHI